MKPSLDLILFTSQLSRSLGLRGTLLLFGTYFATVRILRAATPAFGKLAAIEAKLEGDYRAGMGRLGREGEEVAYVLSFETGFHLAKLCSDSMTEAHERRTFFLRCTSR